MQRQSKILLTGATGMLGRSLGSYLRTLGHQVVTHGLTSADVDLCVDTSDRDAVFAMLETVDADIVINLVALTNVDRCEESPAEAWKLNLRCVETLAGWIGGQEKCHFVQVSTDQVYDGPGPHGEDDVEIVNVYGLSKYAGELAARAAGATVLRTNFFGPSAHPERRSFSDWILANLRGGKPFTAFADVAFSPLSMATLSEAIGRVIERPTAGTFNLGSRTGCSKAEFAHLIARHFGYDESGILIGSQADVGLRARRPTDMRMDSRLFEATFDFPLPDTTTEISRMKTGHE